MTRGHRHAATCILDHRSLAAKLMLATGMILVCLALAGCGDKETSLRLDQLRPGERAYIQRVVTLERAKAVALTDRTLGLVLLDSLASAWGDSSEQETLAGIPTEPTRARLVNELLGKILAAEEDSLLAAPRPDRLQAPLPDVP